MKAELGGWVESFEFVERPVKEFNILTDLLPGDKIRRISDSSWGFKNNILYTFKNYITPDLNVEENDISGYIKYFEFVERPVKPFDIFTDLKPGDKIRRFEDDFNLLKAKETVTFLTYTSKDSLRIKEYDFNMYIKKFELVQQLNKEQEKYMKEELIYNLTPLNDNEYLFTITNQPKLDFSFKDSTKFNIVSQSYPDANMVYDTLYLKGNQTTRTSCIIHHENTSILSTYIDRIKNAIKEYNESITKKDIHKEEYIEAMKTTIKEYVDGTHRFDTNKCALCKVTSRYNDIVQCTICPWMVLTKHKCRVTPAYNVNERITELLDWIEKYKAM
jgi:hypothetical protein